MVRLAESLGNLPQVVDLMSSSATSGVSTPVLRCRVSLLHLDLSRVRRVRLGGRRSLQPD